MHRWGLHTAAGFSVCAKIVAPLRHHSGTTNGCVSFPEEYADKLANEFYKTSTTWVEVDPKVQTEIKKKLWFTETQEKFGELIIIDATGR
jgi:hypothetical protein